MKLIIAGGRDYQLTQRDYLRLNEIHVKTRISTVVSGGAPGADANGEEWASHYYIPVRRFRADWKKHGRAAGPMRNREMAEYADAVALFPGGCGTESMYQEAKKAGIEIFDFRNSS